LRSERGSARIIAVPSPVIGLLLVLALLSATVRAVQSQAWFQENRSHPWLAKAEIEHRAVRERVE
jgi:hypothetical protein